MYDFLEKYSELLVKTVDEKITAKLTPTLVTKPSTDELGSNCITPNLSSKSTKSIKGNGLDMPTFVRTLKADATIDNNINSKNNSHEEKTYYKL
ncbi:hypothetical protein Glove_292g19 [Diversispora epigaea]|uniref:Uncharacterized protein n=1 Tax=Diversispora epigaea TaxID=1348612 RepID=A0A397I110_9GLOM|nr:hypothetical protein Glove_292g19 [Diversispora epigaea]